MTERDFVAAQAIRAARPTRDGSTRTYLLAGLLRCGLCQRRMDSHWINSRPGYRCRHGHTSTRSRKPGQVKTFYVREDRLLTELTARLTSHPAPENVSGESRRNMADSLRDHQAMIVYDGTGWTLNTPRGSPSETI